MTLIKKNCLAWNDSMILKDLIDHFKIEADLPEYLLDQSFNEVFLEGNLSRTGSGYKIEVTTRQDVTHQLFISQNDDYPVAVMSILPNGSLNGMKFARTEGDVEYVSEL